MADHEQNKIVSIDGYFKKQCFCHATGSQPLKKTDSSRAAPTYIINDVYGFNNGLKKNLIEFGVEVYLKRMLEQHDAAWKIHLPLI